MEAKQRELNTGPATASTINGTEKIFKVKISNRLGNGAALRNLLSSYLEMSHHIYTESHVVEK